MNHSQSRTFALMLATIATIFLTGCNSAPGANSSSTGNSVNVNHPYDETANAQSDIDAALALAKTDQKYVMLDFGGNWCPDCIVLAKFYETEPLKAFMGKNFHLVSVDVGTFNKNLDISGRYGNPIQGGVPAVVVLDPAGKMIGSTANGALESARSMNVQQVMAILGQWAPPTK